MPRSIRLLVLVPLATAAFPAVMALRLRDPAGGALLHRRPGVARRRGRAATTRPGRSLPLASAR
jgi:hypothetical protein